MIVEFFQIFWQFFLPLDLRPEDINLFLSSLFELHHQFFGSAPLAHHESILFPLFFILSLLYVERNNFEINQSMFLCSILVSWSSSLFELHQELDLNSELYSIGNSSLIVILWSRFRSSIIIVSYFRFSFPFNLFWFPNVSKRACPSPCSPHPKRSRFVERLFLVGQIIEASGLPRGNICQFCSVNHDGRIFGSLFASRSVVHRRLSFDGFLFLRWLQSPTLH